MIPVNCALGSCFAKKERESLHKLWRLFSEISMIYRHTMHYCSVLLLITLIASSNILAAVIPTSISVSEDIAQKRTEERDLATSSRSPSEEEKRTYHGPEKAEEFTAAAVNNRLEPGVPSAPGQQNQATSSQTQQEERPSAVGNRFDPNLNTGRILENYEDALDVNSPGYVGLGRLWSR